MGDHDRARAKLLLMASREALDRAGRSRALQISKSSVSHRMNHYLPLSVGFWVRSA